MHKTHNSIGPFVVRPQHKGEDIMPYTPHEYAEMAAKANAQGKILEVIDGELVLVDPPPQPDLPPEPETKYTPEERTEFLEGLMEGLGFVAEVVEP